MERQIDLPRQTRGAEIRATSFDEKENTVDLIFTTGATVRRRSWIDGPYDEELVIEKAAVRLDRLNAGAPLLNTHSDWNLSDVLGSVVPGTARIEGGKGHARVMLSRASGDADNVQKIRDGIVRNISVGYIIHRVDKSEADNGTVPIWRVVDWEPIEISAVPVPADPGAQVRRASDAETYRCAIIDREPPVSLRRARMRIRQRGIFPITLFQY